jgi:exosortase
VTLILIVAATFAWLYFHTGTALVSEWLSSADVSYGLALAALAGALAWRRRAAFTGALNPKSSAVPGFVLLLLGVLIYLTGTLGADVFLSRISAVVVLAGAMCFLAGPASTRVMTAPLLFLLLAIPPPALVVTALTLPLQTAASRIGETTLAAAGLPVVRDGNLLHLASTTLEVAEACSGLRSLLSLGALSIVLAWAAESSWPKRGLIIAASVPVAVLVNGLRVALTGFACEWWGRAAAADPWHTLMGWLTFIAALTMLLVIRRLLASSGAPGDRFREVLIQP